MAELLTRSDEDFLASFLLCTLPASNWTHEAHIRLAWICLRKNPPARAVEFISAGILRYNTEVLQRRHKYHETVTVAFTRIIASRMRPRQTWRDFARTISDILDPNAPILLAYYSSDRLFSTAARNRFVEPDLRDLPKFQEYLTES